MYCPQCGISQSDELRFCKSCGANLHAVRQAVATREIDEKFDWSKTWVAEMFLSEGERKRREQELERQRGITPEVKRYDEIKAGVITACVGISVAIFLYVFMQGLILSGNIPPKAVEILNHLWIVGVIPFFVGIGLLINGTFVSKKLVEATRQEILKKPDTLGRDHPQTFLSPADTSEFVPSNFSVTEDETKHLRSAVRKPSTQDNA